MAPSAKIPASQNATSTDDDSKTMSKLTQTSQRHRMWTTKEGIQHFQNLNLSCEQMQKLLGENVISLEGLPLTRLKERFRRKIAPNSEELLALGTAATSPPAAVARKRTTCNVKGTVAPFYYSDANQVVPKNVVWVIIVSPMRDIPPRTFAECVHLRYVDMRNGLASIGNNAFFGCTALKMVRMARTTRSIGSGAFSQCSALVCVVLNEGLEEIGKFCFTQCVSLQFLCLSSTVTHLGEGVCEGCKSLEGVGLNEGLSMVQSNGFHDCENLRVIGIPNSMEQLAPSSIPRTTKREYRKPKELWTSIRDKVAKLAYSIESDIQESYQIISDPTRVELPRFESVRKKTILDAKISNTESQVNRSKEELPKNQEMKKSLKDPPQTGKPNAKSVPRKAQLMEAHKAAKKMASLDESPRHSGTNGKQSNKEEEKAKKLILSRKCDAKTKATESRNCTTANNIAAFLEPDVGFRPLEERMQTLEANMKSQLSSLRHQLQDGERQQSEMISKLAKASETLAAGLESLKNAMRSVVVKQNETDFELQEIRKVQAESETSVSEQVKKIGNDTYCLDKRTSALHNTFAKIEASQALLQSALEEHCKKEAETNSNVDPLASTVTTLSQKFDDLIQTSEGKWVELENQEACLEVMKRAVEPLLENERECKVTPTLDNASYLAFGRKRSQEESNDTDSKIGIVGNLWNWTKSMLPRKKMRGQDDEE
ncbi:unnamed protein product [Cylindrotheca closterium]|uniref:Uncharacterized protein n=1 Tax=Cylindrotheca closterium TaxID=2856 RepID=A0AAD2FND1_9STRA|nr:unnamed protein product [Cylindrotheca closterium]